MTRYYYSDDPTARGDQIAEEMRDYYEAHRETWWQRSRFNPNRFAVGLVADNLMLGLMDVYREAIRTCEQQDVMQGNLPTTRNLVK